MRSLRMKWCLVLVVGAVALAARGMGYAQENRLDVPYVPTPQRVVDRMLEIAKVTKDDVVYDLGCGDGRIVVTAARRMGARGVGVDLDPQRVREANENARRAGVTGRVRFVRQDLFKTDIREASVVTLYLLPEVNLRLRPRLLRDLKPGTRVISHDFDMGEWEPDLKEEVNGEHYGHTLYYWVIPAQVEGAWRVTMETPAGERRATLKLQQQFQRITGTITAGGDGGQEVAIADAKLTGAQISFTAPGAPEQAERIRLTGRVDGKTMAGAVVIHGNPSAVSYKWKATRD